MKRLLTALASLVVVLGQSMVRADEPAKAPAKGYALHEWGVFTSHQDVELANADMRAEWQGLPPFVFGQIMDRNIPESMMPVLKPVVYFHAAETLEVRLTVEFPEKGMPAVWWPATMTPSIGAGPRRIARQIPPVLSRCLTWRLRIKNPPQLGDKPQALEPIEEGSWIKPLRDVAADDVFAWPAGDAFGMQREKFVYYDGLLPRGKWAEVIATKDKVRIRNQGDQPLLDVTAIDLRPNGTVRIARLEKLDGGATVDALEFKETDKTAWPNGGVEALVKQLTMAGLNKDEAVALAKVWQRDFFQTEGLTVFYRLPQAEYDRLLPLKAEPAPKETVRVGLILHPHCESDLAERVAGLVKELASDKFEAREEAHKRLEKLGRAAFVQMDRMRNQSDDADVKHRLDAILEKHDGRKLFTPN